LRMLMASILLILKRRKDISHAMNEYGSSIFFYASIKIYDGF
jgi:hypothetical protein